MYTKEPSISAVRVLTASDTVDSLAGRQFGIICTVAGNVKVGLSKDQSTITIPVATGLTLLPWEVSRVYVTGTTATATYFAGD